MKETTDHTTPASFLAAVEAAGVELWDDAGTLRFRAPSGVLSEQDKQRLRADKPEILRLLGERNGPTLHPEPAARHEPFPLTDVQQAYLLGRNPAFANGGVSCHGYAEIELPKLDLPRLQAALDTAIRRHDMLRAIVCEDGTQQVLADPGTFHITVRDGSEPAGAASLRDLWSNRIYPLGVWPMFDLGVTRGEHTDTLHFSIDFLIADFLSTQMLLDELLRRYDEPDMPAPVPAIGFRDYVLHEQRLRDTAHASAAAGYWHERMAQLPPAPELPYLVGPYPARFDRHHFDLDAAAWSAVQDQAKRQGLSPSSVVLTAFAEVVARWSLGGRFTLDLTLQNRRQVHQEVSELIGDFTDIVLLQLDMASGTSFAERAAATQRQLWQDLDHRDYSGLEVIREINRTRPGTGFPVVFTSSIGVLPADRAPSRGLTEVSYGITQTPQVLLDCQVLESPHGLSVNLDVRQGCLPPSVPAGMLQALEALLQSLSESDTWGRDDVVSLPKDQSSRRRAYHAGAQPVTATAPPALLSDGIIAAARTYPDRPAVISGDTVLTHAQLLACATQLARRLTLTGAAGAVVGIALPKSAEQVVAALGVLLAQAVYLPLDPDQPIARQAGILADAGARWVIVPHDAAWSDELPATAVPIGDLADAPADAAELPPRRDPDELAYVIYTSGSTGRPKGVEVSHASALNTIRDINERFAVTHADVGIALASLGFDLSVWDIFGLLAVGGALVIPDAERGSDPSHWAELIDRHHVSVWNTVPMQLQMLSDYLGPDSAPADVSSLRLALLSGDWIPVGLPDLIRNQVAARGGELHVIGLGGATEGGIWSILFPIDRVDPAWSSIPYGYPMRNQSMQVLDPKGRERPEDVPGEIYIGGASLARGYRHQPQQTAERFVEIGGARRYRTGDHGTYRRVGEQIWIEFLGRDDRQVKLRGHRVELAEVEAALEAAPGVRRAVVVPVGDQPESRKLIGFAEPEPDSFLPTSSAEPDIDDAAAAADLTVLQPVSPEDYRRYATAVDHACEATMAAALEEAARASVSDRYAPALHLWREHLASRGTTLGGPSDPLQSWHDAEAAAVTVGEHSTVEALVSWSQRLGDMLHGREDPLNVLFPSHGPGVAGDLYGQTLPHRWANTLIAEAAAAVATRTPADRGPVRVLEVGAGTGATTATVLAALDRARSGPLEFTVTDVSASFLHAAQDRFAERLHYARFDISRPPTDQGFTPHSFDVIIAADVVHAAPNPAEALGHLRSLLAPSGTLLISEFTLRSVPLLLTMALVPGSDTPLLSAQAWIELLQSAGLSVAHHTPPPRSCLPGELVSVFACSASTPTTSLDLAGLRQDLASRLPGYMIPDRIHVLEHFPLTANGKIDHAALRTLDSRADKSRSANRAARAPQTPQEEALSAAWNSVLERADVPADVGFLELGGDSLLAARLAGHLRDHVPLAGSTPFDTLLRHLLEGCTVAELAAALASTDTPTPTQATPGAAASAVELLVPAADGLSDALCTVQIGAPPTVLQEALLTLSQEGPVYRFATSDDEGVAAIAERAAEQIAGAGLGRIRLLGYGDDAVAAIEAARWLAELCAVDEVIVMVVANRTPPTKELLPYLGRLVIAGDVDSATPWWQDIALGEVVTRCELGVG